MRWSTKWKIPRDQTLNTVNGSERREQGKLLCLLAAMPNIPVIAAEVRGRWEGGMERWRRRPAVTVQLMCVDSEGVIYGLFSAPAVLTNELQAARWHAADNAARLLLQVSSRPSPRLDRLNSRRPSKLQNLPSPAFDSFVQNKRKSERMPLIETCDKVQF